MSLPRHWQHWQRWCAGRPFGWTFSPTTTTTGLRWTCQMWLGKCFLRPETCLGKRGKKYHLSGLAQLIRVFPYLQSPFSSRRIHATSYFSPPPPPPSTSFNAFGLFQSVNNVRRKMLMGWNKNPLGWVNLLCHRQGKFFPVSLLHYENEEDDDAVKNVQKVDGLRIGRTVFQFVMYVLQCLSIVSCGISLGSAKGQKELLFESRVKKPASFIAGMWTLPTHFFFFFLLCSDKMWKIWILLFQTTFCTQRGPTGGVTGLHSSPSWQGG